MDPGDDLWFFVTQMPPHSSPSSRSNQQRAGASAWELHPGRGAGSLFTVNALLGTQEREMSPLWGSAPRPQGLLPPVCWEVKSLAKKKCYKSGREGRRGGSGLPNVSSQSLLLKQRMLQEEQPWTVCLRSLGFQQHKPLALETFIALNNLLLLIKILFVFLHEQPGKKKICIL